MSSTTIAPAVATGPAVTPWRRRLASGLLAVAAISALGSAAVDIAGLATADPELKVLEAWRAYGLVVFAGLFILLALRPRTMRGVWELGHLRQGRAHPNRGGLALGRAASHRRHRRRHHRRRPDRAAGRRLPAHPRLDSLASG